MPSMTDLGLRILFGGVEVGPLQVGIDKLQHPRQIVLSVRLIGGANDGLVSALGHDIPW